ncbi:MAG: TIGR03986 family CRISPR-associated RAMP protein [Acidobacteriota bacterium]|jgi:CRISPR-associated protein (TIGR03986 family)|nr:TIGR03986 family CRISPR-associated RAMP protein [Acidobacteriota bacterium]
MQATAPYNFVPASETVVFPSWADQVSHDVPFRDGLCGYLDLEITTHTPLFIRGHDRAGAFFQTPDGNPALPGTSLRGMLRTVVQIASFGKLGPVNDRRLSMRDLHDADYRRKLASVSAGWLREDRRREYDGPGEDGSPRWTIQPCHFAKIEYGLLQTLFPGFDPGTRRPAHEKYGDPALTGGSLQQRLDVRVSSPAAARRRPHSRAIGDYGEVTRINPTAGTAGTIVLTGQPQEYRPGLQRRKHHDFFFYGSVGLPIDVPFAKRRDFSFIHSTGGEQHRLDSNPNPDWAFWLEKMRNDEPVPVFFLLDAAGVLRAFGLAMMFRLACEKTTGDVVLAAQSKAQDTRPDLAELIFGRVFRSGGTTLALRGRVSLEAAVPDPKKHPKVLDPITNRVLGAPRASYYPNYLVQNVPLGPGSPPYITYNSADAKARGWKRYPSRDAVIPLPTAPTPNVAVAPFAPLTAGARFKTRLHFHNLRRVELGAVLWALDFGGRTDCRHGLGLAKPYGYGAISLEVTHSELIPNDAQFEASAHLDLVALRDEFRAFMEGEAPGWESGDEIYQLLTMARPPQDPAQLEKLTPMVLDPAPGGRNGFRAVKQAGGRPLPRYGEPDGLAAHGRECAAHPPPTPEFLPPSRSTPASVPTTSPPASRPTAFDEKLNVIRALKSNLMGQADRYLDWFASLEDPEERKRAAEALVTTATAKSVKKKAQERSADGKPSRWAAVWEEYSKGRS